MCVRNVCVVQAPWASLWRLEGGGTAAPRRGEGVFQYHLASMSCLDAREGRGASPTSGSLQSLNRGGFVRSSVAMGGTSGRYAGTVSPREETQRT